MDVLNVPDLKHEVSMAPLGWVHLLTSAYLTLWVHVWFVCQWVSTPGLLMSCFSVYLLMYRLHLRNTCWSAVSASHQCSCLCLVSISSGSMSPQCQYLCLINVCVSSVTMSLSHKSLSPQCQYLCLISVRAYVSSVFMSVLSVSVLSVSMPSVHHVNINYIYQTFWTADSVTILSIV